MPAKKDMTGVLFRNDKKESDKHPVYKGQCLVNGVEYWIAGWVNEHEERGKYLSIKFTPKEEKQAPRKPRDDDGQNIPF